MNSDGVRGFTPDGRDALTNYAWPGNVRELRNVVERLLLLTDDDIDGRAVREVVSAAGAKAGPKALGTGPLADRVAAFERETVLGELTAHGYRVAETARALGLERSHLYKKCQQLGLDLKMERTQGPD